MGKRISNESVRSAVFFFFYICEHEFVSELRELLEYYTKEKWKNQAVQSAEIKLAGVMVLTTSWWLMTLAEADTGSDRATERKRE